MRKSIANRILFILIFLTFLFALNTALSGVTNSQVQLSANLISDSFVNLEYEQVLLTKDINQIKLFVETYRLSNGVNQDTVSDSILTEIEKVKSSVNRIADITNEFSKKAMNTALSDAYKPYQLTMEAYLKQAAELSEFMKNNDLTSVQSGYQNFQTLSDSMIKAERDFQEVLDQSIDHEVSLVHSRVTRSTLIIWVMAIIFILSVAIALRITRKTIISPLKKANKSLADIIHKLEQNEGDLTARLECSSDDEVGQIAKGINHFLETLQNAMISIKSGSNMIHHSTENISMEILECKDSTSSISAALNELSASMEEISSTIQNIDFGAQDVLLAANTIAEDAKTNSIHVGSIVERAETIRTQSNQSKEQTETVLKEIQHTMAVSIENSRSVEQINELTSNILGISSQTNLLALNASIEAARAGEAGKGFAIVAEEIRVLAENTRKTANDIQSISTIVTESVEELVKNANEIMSYLSEKVLVDYDGFVEVANHYKQDADTISSMLTRFSTSSGELKNISTNMAGGIQGITLAVEESVNVVIQSSESTNGLLNAITSITGEAARNEEIVSELNHHVNKFKKVEHEMMQ